MAITFILDDVRLIRGFFHLNDPIVESTIQIVASDVQEEASYSLYERCRPYTNTECGIMQGNEIRNCTKESQPMCTTDDEGNWGCQSGCHTGKEECKMGTVSSCVNLDDDVHHCGKCFNECPQVDNAKSICSEGKCNIQCQADFDNCDNNADTGCETNINTSLDHCGGCNVPCSPTAAQAHAYAVCNGGTCKIEANAGFADCNQNLADGYETNLNAMHWITCNECREGYGDCDGDSANGCEVRFSDYGLKSCTECADPYLACGFIMNGEEKTNLPLCLGKKGDWDVPLEEGKVRMPWGDELCALSCNFDYSFIYNNKYETSSSGRYYLPSEITGKNWANDLRTCSPKQNCTVTYNGRDANDISCSNASQ